MKMTLEVARLKKIKAEMKIEKILNQFQEETHCQVDSIKWYCGAEDQIAGVELHVRLGNGL